MTKKSSKPKETLPADEKPSTQAETVAETQAPQPEPDAAEPASAPAPVEAPRLSVRDLARLGREYRLGLVSLTEALAAHDVFLRSGEGSAEDKAYAIKHKQVLQQLKR
jgi:hypothetical protein